MSLIHDLRMNTAQCEAARQSPETFRIGEILKYAADVSARAEEALRDARNGITPDDCRQAAEGLAQAVRHGWIVEQGDGHVLAADSIARAERILRSLAGEEQ